MNDGAAISVIIIILFLIVVAMFTGHSDDEVKPSRKSESRPSGNGANRDVAGVLDASSIEAAFYEAKVVKVIDGDTAVLKSGFHQFRVRLGAIDCPENGQDWGDRAKFGLIKLVGGQRVKCEDHGKDLHGRKIVTLYVIDKHKGEWVNVNEKMVVRGHAWVMRQYYGYLSNERKNQINRLERWAKAKKVGLWGANSPVPPWKWRQTDKEQS